MDNRTDADILDMLAKTNNKQGLIKKALREYRENHNSFVVAEGCSEKARKGEQKR